MIGDTARWWATGWVCCWGLVGMEPRPVAAEGASSAPAGRAAGQTVLVLVRSSDGLTFSESGRLFAVGAASPDLVRLSTGRVLALFDQAVERDGAAASVMAVAQSSDGGRTWSRARPIRLQDRSGGRMAGLRGDLLLAPPRGARLFFVPADRGEGGDRLRRSPEETLVCTAWTRNGLDYLLEDDPPIRLRDLGGAHPTVFLADSQIRLHAAALWPVRLHGATDGTRPCECRVAPDGGPFRRATCAVPQGVRFVGSVVVVKSGLRAYVSSADGVCSMTSSDGSKWQREPGLRLAGAWDPAVVRLDDGSWLMLCCTTADRRPEQVAADPPERDAVGAGSPGAAGSPEPLLIDPWGEPAVRLAGEVPPGAGGSAAPVETAPGEAAALPAEAQDGLWNDWEADGEYAGSDPAHDAPAAESWQEGGAGLLDPGFAPRPDFRYPVDYLAYYRELLQPRTGDNAFDVYAGFIPGPWTDPAQAAEWPELRNMLADPDHQGPPGPWDPGEHPEWAASGDQARDLLEAFREASLHDGYAQPPFFLGEDERPGGAEHGPLLLEMTLPTLSRHRQLARATLAEAWRTEDGAVSSERMLDSWETVLRNADHLCQGATLIEELVGLHEKHLVQETARQALARGVFESAELETALDLLVDLDRHDVDPVRALRGEHAMTMEVVQFLFSPADADGQPRANPERVDYLMTDLFEMANQGDRIERLEQMTPGDVQETVEALDEYYCRLGRMMRVGYPEYRGPELDEMASEEYVPTSPVTEVMLPALGRVHQLRARNEASRRATRLSYAAHLFRARNGRWPVSLDELPAEHGRQMRTDPFTAEQFGYRLTPGGPVIYSLSENGVDDGGVHSPRWGDGAAPDDPGPDDHVFWPPSGD